MEKFRSLKKNIKQKKKHKVRNKEEKVKRKINKKKIILVIIILLVIIAIPTFGRYVYNNIRDTYLKSMNFSFSSNLLTSMRKKL